MLVPGAPGRAVDDFQYWSGFDLGLWQEGRWTTSLWLETRLRDDASEPLGYFAGPGVRYQAHRHLGLSAAIRGIRLEDQSGGSRHFLRYQLAVIPRFWVGALEIEARSRVEFLVRGGETALTRFRHRFRFRWPLAEPRGRLVALYASEELFYSDGEGLFDVNQHRITPIGTRWSLPRNVTLDLYTMIQLVGSETKNVALGTTLSWRPPPRRP